MLESIWYLLGFSFRPALKTCLTVTRDTMKASELSASIRFYKGQHLLEDLFDAQVVCIEVEIRMLARV